MKHMAQLTIYLDDESIRKIEVAAAREKSSVSGWVKKRLIQSLEEQWPEEYFELFGALGEDDLHRPSETGFMADAPREQI
jgi:hypothetical protein